METIVGIIGGMGPEATIDLMQKIIDNTPAERDQDHLHIVVDSNPGIPDRTEAILGRGEDPTPYLLESAKKLENAGAKILVIACNTAHYFLPRIMDKIRIPVLNMPEVTSQYVINRLRINRVGLLATAGTIISGLYQNALGKYGIECIIPDQANQEIVTKVIYNIKAKKRGAEVKGILLSPIKYLVESEGCQAIVAGCTEIPIALRDTDLPVPLVDPADIVAHTLVNELLTQN